MATIHIKRQHELDEDYVREEIRQLADRLSNQLCADYQWEKDRLKFSRTGASGFVKQRKGEIEVEIKLGLMLTPLKGQIEQTVCSYLDQALA